MIRQRYVYYDWGKSRCTSVGQRCGILSIVPEADEMEGDLASVGQAWNVPANLCRENRKKK